MEDRSKSSSLLTNIIKDNKLNNDKMIVNNLFTTNNVNTINNVNTTNTIYNKANTNVQEINYTGKKNNYKKFKENNIATTTNKTKSISTSTQIGYKTQNYFFKNRSPRLNVQELCGEVLKSCSYNIGVRRSEIEKVERKKNSLFMLNKTNQTNKYNQLHQFTKTNQIKYD